MIFRYKVKVSGACLWSNELKTYNVKIQEYRYYAKRFHWRTIANTDLVNLLRAINKDAFGKMFFAWEVSALQLCDELQKYNSMDEVVMEYIKNYILTNREKDELDVRCNDVVDKFVLTHGWNTIEIKENEK